MCVSIGLCFTAVQWRTLNEGFVGFVSQVVYEDDDEEDMQACELAKKLINVRAPTFFASCALTF